MRKPVLKPTQLERFSTGFRFLGMWYFYIPLLSFCIVFPVFLLVMVHENQKERNKVRKPLKNMEQQTDL